VVLVVSGLVRWRMLWAASREGKGVEWMEFAAPCGAVHGMGSMQQLLVPQSYNVTRHSLVHGGRLVGGGGGEFCTANFAV
jgi:hypothetical protein